MLLRTAASILALVGAISCAHRSEGPPPPPSGAPEVPQPAPIALAPAPGPEVEAAAEAAFRALEPNFEAQQAITLGDPKRLKAALTARLQGLTQLERGYEAVTKLGSVEWSVAALVRLGEAYANLGLAIRDAAAPAGLSAEQLELYRSELASRAAPLDEEAAGAYQRAIGLEEESATPSEWVVFARERLQRLRPGR